MARRWACTSTRKTLRAPRLIENNKKMYCIIFLCARNEIKMRRKRCNLAGISRSVYLWGEFVCRVPGVSFFADRKKMYINLIFVGVAYYLIQYYSNRIKVKWYMRQMFRVLEKKCVTALNYLVLLYYVLYEIDLNNPYYTYIFIFKLNVQYNHCIVIILNFFECNKIIWLISVMIRIIFY